MKYARELALIFTPVTFAWSMTYLVGAFVSASWDISEWPSDFRILFAIWGSAFGFAVWHKLKGSYD